MQTAIHILVLEDNLDDFVFLEEMLKSAEDFDVTLVHADRLEKAFSIMQSSDVDLAVIDLCLPDSNGLETFLQFHNKYPLIPAIILSGQRDHQLAFEAVKQGAQDFLFKGEPSLTAIIRTIRYAIERQRLTTQLIEMEKEIKELQSLLPICSFCKKIRDDTGFWDRLESYFNKRLKTRFSHGICPDCAEKHYPDFFNKIVE